MCSRLWISFYGAGSRLNCYSKLVQNWPKLLCLIALLLDRSLTDSACLQGRVVSLAFMKLLFNRLPQTIPRNYHSTLSPFPTCFFFPFCIATCSMCLCLSVRSGEFWFASWLLSSFYPCFFWPYFFLGGNGSLVGGGVWGGVYVSLWIINSQEMAVVNWYYVQCIPSFFFNYVYVNNNFIVPVL